jgi:hypothetical protein
MKRVCSSALVAGLLIGSATGQMIPTLALDTLAWVDDQPILARDMRARVELMPWPGPIRPSTLDSVRSQAVSALIAERLLATEATVRGLTGDRRYDLLRWGLENVLQRDALFRREVAGRSRPTQAEAGEALRRYRENRTVVLYVLQSRGEADSLAARLRRSASVDMSTGGLRILDRDTVAASFGMTDTLLERLVYEIGVSGLSRPHRMTDHRWVVLELLERVPNPLAAKQSDEEQRRAAGRLLQSRLDGREAERYYRQSLARKRARSDSASFFRLAGEISRLWLEDTARYRRPSGFELTSDMVDVLHARLGDAGSKSLVVMEGDDLTVGQVVEMFRYEPFISDQPEGLRFWNRLNEQIQRVAAGEYLAREARARGMISDPSVRSDLRAWNEYWAAGEMIRSIRETVAVTRNDLVDELVARRGQLRGKASVRTQELWTKDPVEAKRLAAAVQQGASIDELADSRPTRSSRIQSDGSSDWYDPVDDPMVGFHALLADSGAVIGPLAVDGGYVVARVLGIRATEHGLRGEHLTRVLGSGVKDRIGHERVNAYIADLAQRRRVRVEADAVKRTALTSVPMFTRRYLGFGGWMNGAPMLLPLWDWVRQLPPSVQWPL